MIAMESPSLITCPRCDSPLAGGSVQGLCARCLGALPLMETDTLMGVTGKFETLPPPTIEELAEFFPQLELLGYLGRGGMGVVYQARQRSLDRLVALKLLAPERAGDPAFARRFAREARSLAALNHPHIVAVYDSGEAGGYFYLLMEYVDGQNLREVLRKRRLEPVEALDLIGPVCDALERAHRRGIIHRDIKPENLLIDRTGVVKIADFGISRMLGEAVEEQAAGGAAPLQAPTLAVGTPAYAAPEQLAAAPLDPRADLYSLGVVLCEMLTCTRPDQIPLAKVRRQLPAKVHGIIAKSVQAAPDARFATAAELRRSVNQAREALEREPRWRKLRLAVGIAAALGLSGVAVTMLMPKKVARAEASEPRVEMAMPMAGVTVPVNATMLVPAQQYPPKAAESAKAAAEPVSRERALQDFENNFTALLDARRTLALEPPEDGTEFSALEQEVHRLELRAGELREWLGGHAADGQP